MRRQLSLLVFVPAVAVASFSPLANAAAQRTFVASYGSPVNTAFNCSITKPCRAFSDAIGVTNPGGEVIVLDSAGYGPVAISQSVKIIAPSGVYAGITVSSGDGILLNTAGIYVVLHGLTINGQGGTNGINAVAASELHVENCVVSGMTGRGIYFSAGTALLIKDSIIRDNNAGVSVVGYATIERSRIERSGVGGLYVGGGKMSIVDSTVSQNGTDGIDVVGADLSLERTVVQGNVGDGIYVAVASLRMNRTVITGNAGSGVLLSDAGSSARLSQTDISKNAQDGIHADAGIVVVAGSSVFDNGSSGIYRGVSADVKSTHDNAVYGNAPDLSGSLNPLAPM